MTNQKEVRPLFKYIGGKTWLRKTLQKEVENILNENKIDTYVEPFVGGMGAFLSVQNILFEKGVKNIYLNDINKEVIGVYETIKGNNSFSLLEAVKTLEWQWMKTIPDIDEKREYLKDELKNAEKFYKNVREKFNEYKGSTLTPQLARLIFLQKHSFNGIYRENSKGFYNTPFNWSGKRTDINFYDKIMEIKSVLNKFNIIFSSHSYENINYKMKNSLYYLDPPYINEMEGENRYNKNHFGLNEQLDLIDKIKSNNFIYSNHYNEKLIERFESVAGVRIKKVERSNVISSSINTRKNKKVEMLVINTTNGKKKKK